MIPIRRRFVHTINPLTGLSEKSNLLSATVLAPTCSLADGYATAFMAMGYERAVELVEKLEKVDVYLIYSTAEEEVKVYSTPGFEQALLKE
ncbi:FAD:protein FMN transferase [Antarcticibacterium sp. 1MA-6-2]|uniref:FAD:protein FMN transferase n=1 Tax=Antarcticibacterium sp. 1MA-6-2 TaxID=2908210 RepID=UPI002882DB42|nr:FAD:protein FMN transferase [Antarcticibacterium sp. 1MA-6-2]